MQVKRILLTFIKIPLVFRIFVLPIFECRLRQVLLYFVVKTPYIQVYKIPGLQDTKLLSCMKFILLINVKMPTIVGILTFISRINTASECYKARKMFVSVF